MKKPFSLWQYLLIIIALSWMPQLWFVLKAETPFEKYFFSSLSMVMVTVATFIAGRYVFKDGFAKAGWHWGKPVHYAAVFLLALFLWFVPSMIELYFGMHKPLNAIAATHILGMFLLRFVATLIPAFGEEFGWRGYMLPRLAAQYGAKKGLLLHAFVWWFWHLPVVIGMGLKSNEISNDPIINVSSILLISIIPSMLHAVIFAYIWAKTESLAVVTVYHAAFDEVRDALENSVGFGPLVNIWQMAVIIIVGALLLWKANWEKMVRELKDKSA
jgi:uncharacterized protein